MFATRPRTVGFTIVYLEGVIFRSSNIRFNIIHRPLSDFFLVYNDRRDDTGRIVDRALIAKFTYLFQL